MQEQAEFEESPVDPSADAAPAVTPRQRVLLVDDSPVAREKISGVLRDLGCSVIAAVDGIEGLRQLKDHAANLDLVILDIQMPKMDGITVLRHMRQLPALATVPIVMLTTQADKETVRTALAQKATDFLRKDSTIPVIAERLRAHLQSARPAPAPEITPRDPELAAELARRIMRERRQATDLERAPWVLFSEGRSDLQDMVTGKNPHLVQFYATATGVLARLRRVYRGIELSYGVEHDRQTVSRLAQREEAPVGVLMVSGRQAEGISVARMVRFTRGRKLPIYLICESLQAMPADHRDGLKKADIVLLERRQLGVEQLQSLFSAHLLPDFLVTGSGLQLHELTRGSGPVPKPGQAVTVRCTGILADGTVCIDTDDRGQPCRFVLGQREVVRAWEEAVTLMRGGGRVLLIAGPELAYGPEGDGNLVPPDATVVYDLELVAVDGASVPAEDDAGGAAGGDGIGDLLQ
ncbi:MAG: response regulator [Candidatus Latescibacterota bacterium]